MLRTFSIALADTAVHNLWTLINTITGAIPTDGILPDRGMQLDIVNLVSNGPGAATPTLTLLDSNKANTSGGVIIPGGSFSKRSTRNTICLKDYNVQASANLTFTVDVEYL